MAPTPISGGYLGTAAAAERLGLSRYALMRAIQRGDLRPALSTPGGRLRFSAAAVDAFGDRLAGGAPRPSGPGQSTPNRALSRFVSLLAAQRYISLYEQDADALLDQVAGMAQSLADADGSWCALPSGAGLICRLASGCATPLLGKPVPPRLAVTDDTAVIHSSDVGIDAHLDPSMRRRLGYRSLLVVPFAVDTGIVGSLAVVAARTGAFSDEDRLSLKLLAEMLGSALRHAAHNAANDALVMERTAALEALQAIDESLQHLVQTASVGLCIADDTGSIEVANSACCALFGFDRGELLGRSLDLIIPSGVAPVRGNQIQFDALTRRGEQRTILASTADIIGADGSLRRAAFFVDITARHQAEKALQRERDFTTAVLETAGCLVAILDRAGRIVRVNRAFESTTGFERVELLGSALENLFLQSDDDAPQHVPFSDLCPGHTTQEHESYLATKHAGPRLVAWSTTVLAADDGEVEYIICTGIDITSRKQAEEQLTRLAHYDSLTGLPNRVLFSDRMAQSMLAMPRIEKPVSLLLIDLDHFKEVNDTLGHDSGDLLLRHVGIRLQGAIRRSDTAARLGGDEFAVLLPNTDQAGARLVAEKVLDALAAPVVLDGPTVHVGGSIGIATAPEHGLDAGTLLRHADVAMYVAKRGGGGAVIYSQQADVHSPVRLTLGGELRQAIAEGQLRLHYQPVVSLGDAEFQGVEALVRWQHPVHGLLPPSEFIGLAEQTGLIVPLTNWVLEEAIRQCQGWHRGGLRCSVAVNLSARALGDHHVAELVATLLARYTLSPEFLTLELTESVVMAQPERAIEVLAHLACLGVRIAIDDFGTGHSSLSYLQRLPVHELKIDRSFVTNLQATEGASSIVPFIMGLGHSLGLAIVVEGVETEETWQRFSALSCDAVQGYYISRPLPAAELERWIQSRSRPAPIADATQAIL